MQSIRRDEKCNHNKKRPVGRFHLVCYTEGFLKVIGGAALAPSSNA